MSEQATPAPDRNTVRTAAVKAATTALAKESALASSANKLARNDVVFVSSAPEVSHFSIRLRGVVYRSYWDNNRKHLCWSIPQDHVEAMKMHHHFVTGRIVQAS